MLPGKRFEAYVENSPVSVMVHGTLERVFNPEKLDQVFEDNAVIQYTKELTFSQCVYMMCDVVTKVEPSVGAWYKSHAEEMTVTRQAVYDKLKHMELPVSAGLVCYCGGELLDCLTNLPRKAADAIKVAELYGDRWTIEDAFLQLTVDLKCEIDTLGYPKAALFGFCLALVAYNIVSLVKGAIRAVWGKDYVEEQLSMYYLTLEVTQVTKGMLISVPPKHWGVFRTMTAQQFANTMIHLARHMNTRKYTKSKRGPKKKPSPKISGKHNHHISTARILSARE